MKLKSLKSINNTYLFNLYDKTLGLNKTIIKLMTESEILGDAQLAEYTSVYDKRYNFPLKQVTMNDYKSGRIKVIFYNKDYRLPNTIPTFLVNSKNGINGIVNISNFCNKTKDGNYNIDVRILYSLLQSGSILATSYQRFALIKNKAVLIRLGSRMYSKLFAKVMNKMFSLSVTPAKNDIIVFLSSLFFIRTMLGRDEDSLLDINKRYALENCKDSSLLVLEDVISLFDFDKDFENLDAFIKSIAKNVPGLEDLTTRAFTEQYVSSYGPNMLMSLEFLPTFIANLGYVMVGSYLNNQAAIENLLGKDITAFIKEFSTL